MKVRQHPQFGVYVNMIWFLNHIQQLYSHVYTLLCSYVEGLAELVVRSGKDIEQLQVQGNRVRKVAATEMNQRSSRYDIPSERKRPLSHSGD